MINLALFTQIILHFNQLQLAQKIKVT